MSHRIRKTLRRAGTITAGAAATVVLTAGVATADPTPVGGPSHCPGLNELQCVLFEAANPRIPG